LHIVFSDGFALGSIRASAPYLTQAAGGVKILYANPDPNRYEELYLII